MVKSGMSFLKSLQIVYSYIKPANLSDKIHLKPCTCNALPWQQFCHSNKDFKSMQLKDFKSMVTYFKNM